MIQKAILILLVCLMPIPVSAYDFKVGKVFYRIIDKTNYKVEVTYENPISFNSYSSDITIPATVEYNGVTYDVVRIGEEAFMGSNKVRLLVLPNSITSIGKNAFESCYSLKSITLSDQLTTIEQGAFRYCEQLETIVIPKTVVDIGSDVFSCCYDLERIIVESGNLVYDSRGDCNAIIETASNTLVAGCIASYIPETVSAIGKMAFYGTSISYLEIPKSVTTIGDYAFSECTELDGVEIPNTVNYIGEGAFGCTALSSINIPEGITVIKVGTFGHCEKLTSVSIPNTVTSIEIGAFENCGFSTITIPKSVTFIEWGSFGYCRYLDTFICLVEQPFELEDNPFVSDNMTPEELGITINTTLYVPKGTKDKYNHTPNWRDFFYDIMELDGNGNVTEISQPPIMPNNETPIYNLNGQRISKPAKGINIIKGKKMLVK